MLSRLTKTLTLVCLILLSTAYAADPEKVDPSLFPQVITEFNASLEKQGVKAKFDAHKKFASKLFADSAGEKTFSDKTGNCRLPVVKHLVTNPEQAAGWAEVGTRRLFETAKEKQGMIGALSLMGAVTDADPSDGLDEKQLQLGLKKLEEMARSLLDLSEGDWPKALEIVEKLLANSTEELKLAYKGLSPAEMIELRNQLFAQTTGDLHLGHRYAEPAKGRRVADLLEKIDRSVFGRVAESWAFLQDDKLLAALAKTPAPVEPPQIPGAKGKLHQMIATPHGLILVGGPEANEYQFDELTNVAVVIDLGGNDIYHEGTTSEKRPILVVIDLKGDDLYQGRKPGIQGSAILGASLLLDLAGNDKYQAIDIAQGSALGGVGVLVDTAGDDTYLGDRRVQGQATGGLGLLLDQAGDDKYRAALLSQGVGGPLGCGALIDLEGKDHYFAGGKYPGGYDDTPGFGSWSQGVGVGPRGVANGGVGVILDGGGDDIYEADYFSHGGGYWFAAGVARDFGGNDQRLGATRENFDGTERTEPRFVRWGTGYGCHYAAGFVIDDEGNDTYQADFAVIAYAWDIAVAGICDLAGDDKYITAGSGVCEAHNAAVSFLYDKSGNDEYQGGIASTTEETLYHPEGGSGNYTFLLDEAGEDKYGRDLNNGQTQLRGWAGAILIDR